MRQQIHWIIRVSEKLDGLKEKLHIDEAVTTGVCTIKGEKRSLQYDVHRFPMGSMGYVGAKKITRAVEKATEMKLPVIIFCCSVVPVCMEGMFP